MRSRAKNKFLVLDHTADVKIRVVGETLSDLFAQALEGLASLLYRDYASRGASPVSAAVKVSSIDVNSLLVDFLSEALYQSDLHHSVFPAVRMIRFTNSELEADLLGKNIARFDRDIKAVTYHGVRIMRNPDGLWQTDVIFDI